MLVIPFDRKLDWKRPPLATLALLVFNLLVFLVLQGGDEERTRQAVAYYYDSGLHAQELPHFRDELRARGELVFVEEWDEELAEPASPWLWAMQSDAAFMARLRAGEVVTTGAPDYAVWRGRRAEFDRRLNEVVGLRWGLTPAEFRWPTLLSHMFLHGDLGHLLGNMFFLLAMGFLVEGAIGGGLFLLCYLLAGLGAVALYGAVHAGSTVPLVGASGAIAGLMGMYAVLFGRRRVRFFYYVGVYFDYVKAPAILLLGLWLGYELLQYFWLAPDSNVAYMAHAGGLLAGASIAFALKRLGNRVDEDYLAENDREAELRARRDEAAAHMARLDFDKAAPILRRLLEDQPQDPELLRALFACVRFDPAAEDYHAACLEVLRLPRGGAALEELVLEVYRDYAGRARPGVRFTAPIIASLAARFCAAGALGEGERLVGVMLKNPGRFPDLPTALLRLGHALQRQGQVGLAQRYFGLLIDRFPDTPEARRARQTLPV